MDLDDLDDDQLNAVLDKAELEVQKTESQKNSVPSATHLKVLYQYFGHESFRPLQWQIISYIIEEKRDICCVIATGYGKSLCYQFPAMFLDGIVLVISPLIALMEDQVLSLSLANIPACLLGSAQRQQKRVIDEIFESKYKLVYSTPEFCTGDLGQTLLNRMSKELKIVLIAIDEAHCISSWGHDFRHQYRRLGILQTIFFKVPMIALTATATPKVKDDIINNLKLRHPIVVCSGFDRPNLYLEVNTKSPEGVSKDLRKFMVYDKTSYKFSGSTIIYCITRKNTEEIATILKSDGIKSLPYHAGLPLKTRTETHELFVKDKIDVIVATIAFGMGIDKPDIRTIIHYGASKSIENFYQEVGRAGRDGLPATCSVFYNARDFQILRHLNSSSGGADEKKESALLKMENYLMGTKCRRRFILEHFGEATDHLEKARTSCCDICTKKLYDTRSDFQKYEGLDENGHYNFTTDAKLFLNAVSSYGRKFGLKAYILFLRGSASAKVPEAKRKLPLYGAGKGRSDDWWQALSRILVHENLLCEKTERGSGFQYQTIVITDKGMRFMNSDQELLRQPPTTILKMLKPKAVKSGTWIRTGANPSSSKAAEITESEAEVEERMGLYRKLLDERTELAFKFDCMPYMVASSLVLMQLSKLKPKTVEELRALKLEGFPEAKISKFGGNFLRVINENPNLSTSENKVMSIKNVLEQHPLPGAYSNVTGLVSCAMLRSGMKIEEIAEKRGLSVGTISNHLISSLKLGEEIKLNVFGIDEKIKTEVVSVFRKFCPSGFESVSLIKMKESCSGDITYDQIKAILAYLELRCHLDGLKVKYHDFDDCNLETINNVVKEASDLKVDSVSDDSDMTIDDLILEMDQESVPKKIKIDNEENKVVVNTQNQVTGSKEANVKTKKNVMPWMVVRKLK